MRVLTGVLITVATHLALRIMDRVLGKRAEPVPVDEKPPQNPPK